MTRILHRSEIEQVLPDIDIIQWIEEGFIAYSRGKVVVPPVGELIFKEPPGDVHIKYGYIINDEHYVIKIASGFYGPYAEDPSYQSGLMLVFKQRTGELIAILLDEGLLTNVRTAAAGAVTAKCLAPKKVRRIGLVGAGIQARLQLEYIKGIVACRDVLVWGLNQKELDVYKTDMEPLGFCIQTTQNTEDIARNCNFIITATPSQSPLLFAEHIQTGTHITAVGSDTPEKQELDPQILHMADLIVADSISQCLERGEIHHALKAGQIHKDRIVELGEILSDPLKSRTSDNQTTVADLTGVAVQDIQIAKAVCEKFGLIKAV